jgi:hypothetical protein
MAIGFFKRLKNSTEFHPQARNAHTASTAGQNVERNTVEDACPRHSSALTLSARWGDSQWTLKVCTLGSDDPTKMQTLNVLGEGE